MPLRVHMNRLHVEPWIPCCPSSGDTYTCEIFLSGFCFSFSCCQLCAYVYSSSLGPWSHQPATVNSEKRTQNTKVLGRAEVPMTYKATRGSSCWPGICPDSNPHVLVFNYEKRGTVTFGSATGAGEAGEDTSS